MSLTRVRGPALRSRSEAAGPLIGRVRRATTMRAVFARLSARRSGVVGLCLVFAPAQVFAHLEHVEAFSSGCVSAFFRGQDEPLPWRQGAAEKREALPVVFHQRFAV